MNNKKRKKCKSCIYRNATNDWKNGHCNYILIKKKMRGCPAEDCTKYEKGARISLKEE